MDSFENSPYWICDITPWVFELNTRMREAAAKGIDIINLSYTHPSGFFPPQILRRRPIRDLLKQGWKYDNSRNAPINIALRMWEPDSIDVDDLTLCDLAPFEEEINRREEEAELDAEAMSIQTKEKRIPIIDLTSWNEDGAIPDPILKRLKQRQNPKWRQQIRDEIEKLMGQANKDESFAITQLDRVEMVENPAKIIAAAKDLRIRAASFRKQAEFLMRELG